MKNAEKWGRVGKSGEKWWKVAKSGGKWGKVAKSGEKWRKVAKSGEKWRKVETLKVFITGFPQGLENREKNNGQGKVREFYFGPTVRM